MRMKQNTKKNKYKCNVVKISVKHLNNQKTFKVIITSKNTFKKHKTVIQTSLKYEETHQNITDN